MNYKLKNGDKISSTSIAVINVTKANTDLNDYTENGTYYFSPNVTPINIPAGVNGWLVVIKTESGSIKQFWFREGTANSNDYETYVRTLAGTWGNWNKYVTEVESGSNSNGKYIKYSDGTMICSNKITRTVDITNSYEGSYYANVQGIYFPKSFTSAPTITATATVKSSLVAFNFSSVNNDSCNGYVWKSQSKSSVSMDLSYIAIGRWK